MELFDAGYEKDHLLCAAATAAVAGDARARASPGGSIGYHAPHEIALESAISSRIREASIAVRRQLNWLARSRPRWRSSSRRIRASDHPVPGLRQLGGVSRIDDHRGVTRDLVGATKRGR